MKEVKVEKRQVDSPSNQEKGGFKKATVKIISYQNCGFKIILH